MINLLVINKGENFSLVEESDYKDDYYSYIEQKFTLEDNDKYFVVVVEYTTCSTFAPVTTEYHCVGCYKTKSEAKAIIDLIESKPNIKGLSYREEQEVIEKFNKEKEAKLGFSECCCPWMGFFETYSCSHLLTWCKD